MTRLSHRQLTGAGAVTAGAMVANITAYLLHVPASRWLGPAGYGEFAALVSAQLLVAVPALALQAVVARETVHGVDLAALRRLGSRSALLVAICSILLVIPVSALLDTSVVGTAAALASGPALCLLATDQGLLQGREAFGALGAALALAGSAKVAPVVTILAAGGGTTSALSAGAVGVLAAWLIVRAVLLPTSPDRTGRATGDRVLHTAPSVGAVLAAGQAQLVMMALTSVDLLLARTLLDPVDAGRYALGAVATKAAFWLPQAVGTILYPRMAEPGSGHRATRTALRTLCVIGLLVVLGTAAAAPVAPLVAGDAYRPVTGFLWAFAALGVLCSLVQAMLFSAIARDRTAEAVTVWAGLALAVVLIWCAPRTIGGVLCASAVATTLTAVTLAATTLTAATPAAPASRARRPRG